MGFDAAQIGCDQDVGADPRIILGDAQTLKYIHHEILDVLNSNVGQFRVLLCHFLILFSVSS